MEKGSLDCRRGFSLFRSWWPCSSCCCCCCWIMAFRRVVTVEGLGFVLVVSWAKGEILLRGSGDAAGRRSWCCTEENLNVGAERATMAGWRLVAGRSWPF